jgi:hypothetical protein
MVSLCIFIKIVKEVKSNLSNLINHKLPCTHRLFMEIYASCPIGHSKYLVKKNFLILSNPMNNYVVITIMPPNIPIVKVKSKNIYSLCHTISILLKSLITKISIYPIFTISFWIIESQPIAYEYIVHPHFSKRMKKSMPCVVHENQSLKYDNSDKVRYRTKHYC